MDLRYLLSDFRKKQMKVQIIIFSLILGIGVMFLPATYAEPTVSIVMEKTTYSYCERLFYIIEVSEVTGDPAIIHIRDEVGDGGSAIPIPISNLQTPIPAIIPFEKGLFQLGKYFIDVKYSSSEFTIEFELVDSNNICIPQTVKMFFVEWINDNMSDGYMMDAIQKYVDPQLIEIPFEITDENIHEIEIPEWLKKNTGDWWAQGLISDNDFAQVINYLIDKKYITSHKTVESNI